MRKLRALACACAVALASAVVCAGAYASAPLRFTLSPSIVAAPGAKVAMPPVGLSIEYPTMAAALGAGPCPAPALAHELDRLGSPPLELAGFSQDMTVPSGELSGQEGSWLAATLYSLPAGFWGQLHCLLESTREPLTVGLNLKTGTLAWAQRMVEEARKAAVNGLSFSLGNEPDLYELPNYSALSQPLPGGGLVAANLYVQLASALAPALAGAPLVGPELALPDRWRSQFARVVSDLHDAIVGVHMYPLTACHGDSGITADDLLSNAAGDDPVTLAWVVDAARRLGLPAIISEANSASCGGVPGVSDSPVAAVWAVRFVLSALEVGFQEVRFHLSGNAYDPFLVRGGAIVRRPLDDALELLNQWMPPGASLRSVHAAAGIGATAIAQPRGGIVLVLDNERTQAQRVLLGSALPMRVQMLSAASRGVGQLTLDPQHGASSLVLAPNSVVAVSVVGPQRA